MPPDSRSSSCSGPPSSTPGFDGGAGRTTWHVGSEHSAAYHTNKVCSPWGPPGMASFVRTHPPMSVGAEESTPKSFCSVMDSSLISIDAFCQPTSPVLSGENELRHRHQHLFRLEGLDYPGLRPRCLALLFLGFLTLGRKHDDWCELV